jgi:hypothetical protein
MLRRPALLGIGVLMIMGHGALAQGNNSRTITISPTQNAPPITVSPPITSTITTSPTINPRTNSRSNANATGGQGGTSGATANPMAGASSGSSAVTISTGNTTNQNPAIPADTILRSAPTIYIPSISTGNVCALGASAGASWIAASIGFGVSWESMQCERRQAAALLWNMGTPESRAAAKEVLCNTPELRNAYKTIGSPCAADLMQVTGPAKPEQIAAPQSIPPQPPFDGKRYASVADCMTAAMGAGLHPGAEIATACRK